MQNEERQAMPPQSAGALPLHDAALPANEAKSAPPEDTARKLEQLAGDIGRIRQATDLANSDTLADLTRLEAELEELQLELKARKRTGAAQWVMLGILAAAVIGAGWYGFKKHAGVISKLTDSFHSLGTRVDATEQQLRAWAKDRDILTGRVAKLESRVTANLRLARKESREMASQVSQRLQLELDRRMEQLIARLNRVESNQAAESARLEQLQDQLGELRKPVAQAMPVPDPVKEESAGAVADVNLAAAPKDATAHSLLNPVGSAEMDFAVIKGESQELAPGISLTVTRANAGYQNVDGWLKLIPDRGILRVRGQDVGQPVSFYTQQSKAPYELVFTRVTKNAVTGYLLIPAQGADERGYSGNTEQAYSAAAPTRSTE